MFKFNVYADGLGYAVDLIYTKPDRTLTETKKAFFSFNRTTALMYAHKHFRLWLAEQLVKYVNHADILMHTGKGGFYTTNNRVNSMDRLKDYIRVVDTESIRGLVLQVLNLEQDLRNVLPSSKNNSYQSSHERVEDMIEQCRRYRKLFIKTL